MQFPFSTIRSYHIQNIIHLTVNKDCCSETPIDSHSELPLTPCMAVVFLWCKSRLWYFDITLTKIIMVAFWQIVPRTSLRYQTLVVCFFPLSLSRLSSINHSVRFTALWLSPVCNNTAHRLTVVKELYRWDFELTKDIPHYLSWIITHTMKPLYKPHPIPKLLCFSSRLVLVQSIEARC